MILGLLLGNFPAGFSGTATTPLTLPGAFVTTGLNFFHVQANSFDVVQPPFSITFGELRVTGVIPEPSSLALAGLGVLGLVTRRRRR